MRVKTSDGKVVAAEQTDKGGRFRFTGVPCKVPLQFDIRNEGDRPEYFLFDRDRMFNPGEVRENDRLKPRRLGQSSTNVRSPVPLANSVDTICRNARSCGMRALLALLGDDSGNAARTTDQLFDVADAACGSFTADRGADRAFDWPAGLKTVTRLSTKTT